MPRSDAISDLGLRELVQDGQRFATGEPMTFGFARNLERAPEATPGDPYQQRLEPAGMYVVAASPGSVPPPGWVLGTARVESPLVLDFNTDIAMLYGPTSWKARLAERYGATGRELTDALIDEGYDAVVTVRPFRDTYETSEIVLLMPDQRRAKGFRPKKNPSHWERLLPQQMVTHARGLYSRLRASQREAALAYERGDVEVAESWDAHADELAEDLENYLDDIEFEWAEKGQDELDVVPFGPFDADPRVFGGVTQGGGSTWGREPVNEKMARIYDDYVRTKVTGRPANSAWMVAEDIDELLVELLRANLRYDAGGLLPEVSDEQVVEAARDAYLARLRTRSTLIESSHHRQVDEIEVVRRRLLDL